ncbi:MAG: hypothetical protein GX144_02250 [Clostridiaceae bacterium]|nr:hypothetical protein [Clostridiaceae bacterium]
MFSRKMKRMKRYDICILLFAVWMTISGCDVNSPSKGSPEVSPTPAVTEYPADTSQTGAEKPIAEPSEAPRTEIKAESVRDMAQLVFDDCEPSSLLAYVNRHMGRVSVSEADDMLLILESVQKAWLDYYLNIGTNAGQYERSEWVQELTDNGFRLEMVDNREVPVMDYMIYEKWSDQISEWFRDYITIIKTENDAPAVRAGQLSISKEELEERLISASVYIENYPLSVRVNEVIDLYDSYLYAYLYGYERDPVINFASNTISREYFNRYREFAQNNPELKAAALVFEYASMIEKGNFMLTEEIRKFLENIFSELDDKRIVVRNDIGRKILMERLQKLLPEKTGFVWKCFGVGGYAHTACLTGIHTEDGNPVYTITGAVEDPYAEQTADEQDLLELQYRIQNYVLFQIKTAPTMADSDFDELEIIRYPLITGHRWYQYPEADGIGSVGIETEIIGVVKENGQYYYEVESRDPATGDYERRLLQAGKGTVAFTKLRANGETIPYEVGYVIDEEQSGYTETY